MNFHALASTGTKNNASQRMLPGFKYNNPRRTRSKKRFRKFISHICILLHLSNLNKLNIVFKFNQYKLINKYPRLCKNFMNLITGNYFLIESQIPQQQFGNSYLRFILNSYKFIVINCVLLKTVIISK